VSENVVSANVVNANVVTDSSQVDVAELHGRNRITSRAIRSVVSAIAASELNTSARAVGVDLADNAGALAVTVSAPVGLAPLLGSKSGSASRPSRVDRAPSPSTLPASTVLERATAAQQTIRSRVLELTGSAVGTVHLRLTSARITGEERVR
jgi:hypothetical protein